MPLDVFGYTPDRDVIDILSALLTPLVAIAAVCIGVLQWRLARNKLKLDLFDRRWKVYEAAQQFLISIIEHGAMWEDARVDFIRGVHGAQFLYSENVRKYLIEELHRRAVHLKALEDELPTHAPGSEPRAANARQQTEILKWINAQFDKLDELLGPYLKLRHW